ncbi:hypothetical protein FAZ19_07205 [Sphingobacterium alkalisoli]|uniref:Uncharacterized protein n=1 Tax=Sphingobacterium alkalisoli TaxID=1874115 RepID=A0A4V5LYN8_9SPHI|nr:hypothetical protein [Sphingobacterium alkalisoli]TJY66699.1 hypothetical protein FAZ19_07205 [Sphingobacterium alkalisoli]GGH14742.1 hypothetical protein GCM10011418_15910 [Sphingobacterium alkalisoli]
MSDNNLEKDENPSAEELQKYENSLQLVFYEGQISWQMNVLFVGLNIGIGTILQSKLENFDRLGTLTVVLSIIGLIINTFWLGTFFRNNRYYEFRMAQARSAEPEQFNLVNGAGFKFSNGQKITFPATSSVEKSKHKLSSFEQLCSNKMAILVSIICFLGGFLFLLIASLIPSIKVLCK